MLLLIILVVCILIGLYFFISGFFPIKIEISHITSEPTATIYKKSMIPPFKDIEITVRNLKQAVLSTKTSSHHNKNGAHYRNYTYRVELESSDGTIVPVTNYYSSGFISKQRLVFKINKSIEEKTAFEYTITQYSNIFIGAICILLPSIILYVKFIK